MPRSSRLHSWIGLAVFLVSASTLAGEPQAKIGAKLTDFERVDAGGKAFKLTQVLQGSKAVVVDFWSSHTPEAYLVTPDGVLAYHGNLDEIGGALDAVLAGKAVPKSETRAFGCSIKRP